MSSTRPARALIAAAALLLLVTAVAPARAAGPAPTTRPNVVLILADDMGFSDVGCFGSEIATPNIDRLAREGMRLTQFYNTGRCCPTRACLLTGLYPHQAGVGHMVEDKGFPGYQGYLNDSCVTIAEALRPAGYHPLMVGKWHVGEKKGHWPTDRGFEHAYSLISGGTNYFKLDKGRIFGDDDKSIDPTGGPDYYLTDDLTDHAVKYLDEYARKPEPFFLYMAYTAPHWPLHARPADIARYKGKYLKGWDALREERRKRQIALGIIDANTQLTPRDSKAPAWDTLTDEQKQAMDLRMAVYAAQIDREDQGIGRILDKLKETGAEQNTLVLFLADNGGCAEVIDRGEKGVPPGPRESFLSYGLPWANASNTPFRLYKHWVHEGGISTPFVARWPGHIQPETKSAEPSHLVDLMPTFLELAKAEYPKERNGKATTPLVGRSLVPLLRGESVPAGRVLYWEHEGNRAVRQGNWKLVAAHNEPFRLYDIRSDRAEMHDFAAEQAGKAKELKGLYQAWAARSGVLPWNQVNKPAGAAAAKPKAGGE